MLPLVPYIYNISQTTPFRNYKLLQWSTKVRPHLYSVILVTWALALFWFHPRLVSIVDMAQTPWQRFNLWFFVLFIELAWLYGLYNIFLIVFAQVYRKRKRFTSQLPSLSEEPAVAILYTTCNDFVEESAASCIRQNYSNFKVYLLDDS